MSYTKSRFPGGETVVCVPCRLCNRNTMFVVPTHSFEKWERGALIQNALPMLAPDQRELLITNTCGECFDKMFPPDDDGGVE